MAVPLYDMITVIWIRVREGRSPFQADKSHFSHRLVDLGLTKGQAVLTIYLTTATCGLGALLLQRVDLVGAVVIVLMIVCILGLDCHPRDDGSAEDEFVKKIAHRDRTAIAASARTRRHLWRDRSTQWLAAAAVALFVAAR